MINAQRIAAPRSPPLQQSERTNWHVPLQPAGSEPSTWPRQASGAGRRVLAGSVPAAEAPLAGRGTMQAVAEQQTVVAIEDDPDIADLLDLYLRNAGFRALLAPSGERGARLGAPQGAGLASVRVGLPRTGGVVV